MNSHARSLMFLFGMAPLGLGCGGSKGDGDSDGTDTGETGTSDGGSTGASGDGSTTNGSSGSTDDGGTTTGGGDLCDDYAAAYGSCYGPDYAIYALEWCEYAQAYYQGYGSPACLAAWEANIACRAAAPCGYSYDQCQSEQFAQIQACYYGSSYFGCDLIGQMVGGCISPAAGVDATLECEQTYDNLYAQHGGWCGDAFLEMMVCISGLECQALSDKQYVFDNCGPEILAKKQACQ